jgi:hypothetical protein
MEDRSDPRRQSPLDELSSLIVRDSWKSREQTTTKMDRRKVSG